MLVQKPMTRHPKNASPHKTAAKPKNSRSAPNHRPSGFDRPVEAMANETTNKPPTTPPHSAPSERLPAVMPTPPAMKRKGRAKASATRSQRRSGTSGTGRDVPSDSGWRMQPHAGQTMPEDWLVSAPHLGQGAFTAVWGLRALTCSDCDAGYPSCQLRAKPRFRRVISKVLAATWSTRVGR